MQFGTKKDHDTTRVHSTAIVPKTSSLEEDKLHKTPIKSEI